MLKCFKDLKEEKYKKKVHKVPKNIKMKKIINFFQMYQMFKNQFKKKVKKYQNRKVSEPKIVPNILKHIQNLSNK